MECGLLCQQRAMVNCESTLDLLQPLASGAYLVAMITCPCILPDIEPDPYRCSKSAVARSVTSSILEGLRASSSFHSGVPWQYATAGTRGFAALLSLAIVWISMSINPAAPNSASIRDTSWYPCGVRARNSGGSSGKMADAVLVTQSANSFSSMRS